MAVDHASHGSGADAKNQVEQSTWFFVLAPYISLRYFSQQAVTPVTVEAR